VKEGAQAADRGRERWQFFRQSGWLLAATVLSGACFALVHVPAGRMASRAEWSLFVALLDSLYLLAIPAGGLQAVFARMTAAAVDEEGRRQVRSAARQVLGAVTLVWLGVVGAAWAGSGRLAEGLRIGNPAALWLTLGVGLAGLWYPVFGGLVQGAQRFFWLGLAQIAGGAGRLVGIALTVMLLGGLAAGAMAGVLLGAVVALGLAMWASRREWWGPGSTFEWGPWVRWTVGLTLGLAPGSILLSGDTLLVQSAFGDEGKALYLAAGRIGRGLVQFTTPVAVVLFPKIARSAATGEPTGALRLALGATLSVGVLAALGCTLMPGLTLRILFGGNPAFLGAAELVPWFVWCMLPLTAAYTLVNNLLARGRFGAVPWLLGVAAAYAATLWMLRETLAARPMFEAFRLVVLVLGGFSLTLLGVAAAFSNRRDGAGMVAPRV
jgi:O-antigen/teichoic acid export membrane protein